MFEAYASQLIQAPVDVVWDRVGGFDSLPRWHPGIVSSERVAHPGPGPGPLRRLTTKDGAVYLEARLEHDAHARSYAYAMLEGPLPVRDYHAKLRVTPVTATGQTFVEWSATFAPQPGHADEAEALARKIRDELLAPGLKGLAHTFLPPAPRVPAPEREWRR
ncbi:SRPBCC family protein [Corallococcus sp. BB11-1]|uniref:SRPBCC family protein n=1 Tax=Corallococcus sp. BB11-1 TaxID=2996783 RepID=UPI00226EA270|nr:SRPBCC family protein [Corallococcus sp. BB11-1]MCY1036131.1 SRPBCC family protein [Corallococcus sp. BB11-1]